MMPLFAAIQIAALSPFVCGTGNSDQELNRREQGTASSCALRYLLFQIFLLESVSKLQGKADLCPAAAARTE